MYASVENMSGAVVVLFLVGGITGFGDKRKNASPWVGVCCNVKKVKNFVFL